MSDLVEIWREEEEEEEEENGSLDFCWSADE